MALWFVYRSHYEGPLSRRVRHLRAGSVLSWFQARMAEARAASSEEAAGTLIDDELGGRVHSFGTLFSSTRKHLLTPPNTTGTLKKLLREHLYVEGAADENIRLDDHSFRVRTDDDEVQLAYFLFDDETATNNPDRLSWVLHQEPRLPEVPPSTSKAEPRFAPPLVVPELAGFVSADVPADQRPPGVTYACLLTYQDSDSLPGKAVALPGVRLPGLAAHLRGMAALPKDVAADSKQAAWPLELRLLRGLLEDGEETIGEALTRAGGYPIVPVGQKDSAGLGYGTAAEAKAQFEAAGAEATHPGDPAQSIVYVGEHAALLCAHASQTLGFQQWVIFDDVWAAAHRDLAASILRYASDWDPLPRRARAPAKGSDPAQAAARLQDAATRSQEKAFSQAMTDQDLGKVRSYKATDRYAVGDLVGHEKFGTGRVQRVDGKRIEVCFKDAMRLLVHEPGKPVAPIQAPKPGSSKARTGKPPW